MKLRGIARLAAAVAGTALFVGVTGAPAHAEGSFGAPAQAEGTVGDFPGSLLNIDEDGVWAATAEHKSCKNIAGGSPVVGRDGWLFTEPAGDYKNLQYIFLFVKGTIDEPTDGLVLVLNDKGAAEFDLSKVALADKHDLHKLMKSDIAPKLTLKSKTAGSNNFDLPTVPPRAGVAGQLTDGGGWLQTPAGWLLAGGIALTNPLIEGRSSFELVSACPAGTESPSPSVPASPSASAPTTPSLPVTGTNVWLLTGGGAALIAAGAVLFLAYRRRQSVKFVA